MQSQSKPQLPRFLAPTINCNIVTGQFISLIDIFICTDFLLFGSCYYYYYTSDGYGADGAASLVTDFNFNTSIASLHTYLGGTHFLSLHFILVVYVTFLPPIQFFFSLAMPQWLLSCRRSWRHAPQDSFLGWWCCIESSPISSPRYLFFYIVLLQWWFCSALL